MDDIDIVVEERKWRLVHVVQGYTQMLPVQWMAFNVVDPKP